MFTQAVKDCCLLVVQVLANGDVKVFMWTWCPRGYSGMLLWYRWGQGMIENLCCQHAVCTHIKFDGGLESVAESREKVCSSGGGALFAQEHNTLCFLHCSGFLFWVFFYNFFFQYQFVVGFLFLFMAMLHLMLSSFHFPMLDAFLHLLYSTRECKKWQELKDLSQWPVAATVVNALDKITGDGE